MWKIITLGLLLGGCSYNLTPLTPVASETYSRSEIDAINVESQCKLLARNLLQLDRCKVRR